MRLLFDTLEEEHVEQRKSVRLRDSARRSRAHTFQIDKSFPPVSVSAAGRKSARASKA